MLSRKTWDKLDEADQRPPMQMIEDNQQEFQDEIRKADGDSYRKMQKRGPKLVNCANPAAWQASGRKLREMIGRIYDRALLERVEAIAAKHR